MAVQSTLNPRGYTPGNVAQAQDAAVFERSGAGVYLTIEWIATYIQTALGNGSAISFGTTNPANTVGEQDDVFFNIGTGEVLSKGASTWSTQANFALDTEVTAAITAAITAHSGATDPHPIYLTQAEATALYKPLTTDDSVATGLRFALKTAQTGTPVNGEIQFNNATLASVTSLLIAETGRDGSAIANLLDLLQQSTRIIVQVEQSEGLYAWFNIIGAPTDSGTYRTVPVAFVTAPTGVTTVAGLGTAGTELTLDFYGVGSSPSVGSGVKFQYNSSIALPAPSKQFRANTATPETATSLSFSVVEDQSSNPSVAAILARLKTNAIIEVRQSATCYYRYNCTADAVLDTSATPNAYTVSVSALPSGSDAIVVGSVFLTIVSNAPSAASGGTAQLISSTLTAFGDSITVGAGASTVNNCYINKIASVTGWTLVNSAVNGAETIDQADAIFSVNSSNSTQYIVMLGFNDLRDYGSSIIGQNTFSDSIKALTAWLSIPSVFRLKGQSTNITYVGSWSNSSKYGGNLSKESNTVGNTATFSFSGTALIVGYTKIVSGTGNFSVSIDGAASTTVSGSNVQATLNGRNYGPAIAIFDNLSETFHTAVLTILSGTVAIEWVAGVSNSTTFSAAPHVFIGNVIRMDGSAFTATPSFNIDTMIGVYNNLLKTALQALTNLGLKIIPVSTNYRFNLANRAADNIHPNDAGHDAIANAFIDKIRSTPGLLLGSGSGSGGTVDPNILSNDFTAANGTTIVGKYSAVGGNPWTKFISTSSNGEIQNNQATSGAGSLFVVRNLGLTSYTYTADFALGTISASNAISFIIRATTGTQEQGFFLQLITNQAKIYSVNGPGVFVQIGSDISLSLASATIHNTSIVVTPTNINWSVNGSLIVSLANTNYQLNTGVGFALQGTGFVIDNFLVVP